MSLYENKRALTTLAIILIVVVVAVAAVATTVVILTMFWPISSTHGSGNFVTKEKDFSDFTIVEVGHAFEVDITQSNSYSVSITADDNVWDYIQVAKTGETLTIGLKPNTYFQTLTLRAEITMPELYEVELSGATRGSIEGFSSSHKFILDLSGASYLSMADASYGDIDIDLSGASRVELEGEADDLRIDASGASTLELSDFPVHNANVNLSGASTATIKLDGRLDADLSGASNLGYIGEPEMGNINTSGASTISKK